MPLALNFFIKFFSLISFLIIPATAATYTLDGTKNALPSCGGNVNNWSVSGSTYTCNNNSVTLASGDIIVSTSSYTLSVPNGITLSGNNTVGSSTYAINLISTNSSISLGSGSSVYGNITGGNGVSMTNSTVTGNVTSANGTVSITGGSIRGNVYSGGGSGIIANGANITATTIQAPNNTISITGGTISGAFSTNGGSGVVLTNVTMTSGSITTSNVGVTISGSTIGTTNSVTISAGNTVTVQNSSAVYGTITAPTWGSQTIYVDGTSAVYGTCTPDNYGACQALPLANYRFDECLWEGSVGEVLDNSGNGYNATAYGTTTVGDINYTVINRDGNFTANATSDYVKLDPILLNGKTDFTVTLWIKSNSSTSSQALVSGANSSRFNEALLFFKNGTTFSPHIKDRTIDITIPNVMDNVWHHLVWTRNGTSGQTCLVIDGNTISKYCGVPSFSTGSLSVTGLILAQEQDSVGGSFDIGQDFEGYMDEVKFFSSIITDAQITSMYTNEKSGKNYDGTTRASINCNPIPIAEYRFDECSLNGTSGEVTDSSGNNYSGTLKNKTMTPEAGKVCRAPSAFLSDAYVEIPAFPNLTANQTITAWFNTSDVSKAGQRIFQDDQFNTYGYALSVGDGGNATVRFYDRTQSNSGIIDSDAILQNNTWYFVAGVTNVATGMRYLYIYNASGTLLNSKSVAMSNTARGSDTGVATIGGEADGGNEANSNYRFSGAIDEVKVFDKALTLAQINTIALNEAGGFNYDGSARTCNSCMSTCFSDDFNRASLGSKWSIISSGTYPPSISDNKLMLTQNRANIASGISLIGSFPSSNNLIEIEFEHNAYAGSGADGVSVILSDANTTPVAGGFGGSLGYAPKDSTLGFAGAWLGFGLDEYGNFSNDNDGNKGRGCAYRPTTAILDSLTIRGRGATNRVDGYCFISNSGNLQSATGVGIDTTSSTTPAPKNKYKFIIDTRSGTKITAQRDINGTSGYVTLPNMNEVNATQTATAPDNFKLSFTGSTGGATNYHSFDDLNIRALSCGTLGKDQNNTSSFFDAWEIGATYNISNRVIQTKTVGSSFNLNIFALNAENTAYQDFNGTVCARVVDSNDKNLTGWTKVLFNQASPYVNAATFSSDIASKDAQIALSWKKNVDTTCPLSLEDNSTKSTDHFAIRPKNFTISTPSNVYAAETFTLDFKALNASGSASLDYNETKDSSFSLNYTIDNNSSCALETLNVASFSFANGAKLAVDANYSDVGNIQITIAEKSGAEFAKIDASDTSNTSRLITSATTSVHVLPYELNITSASFNASTGQSWLYDANVSDMYVKANATVQANNKNHTILKNFTALCGEAKDVDVTFYYDVNNTNKDVNLSYNTLQGVMSTTSKGITDINKTMTIPSTAFTTASASAEYTFNIDRSYQTPLSPVLIRLKDINVTSTSVAKNENNATLNTLNTFYYGRIKTKDITTDTTTTPHFLHVEIYSTYPLSGFHQNSLNWWLHKSDGLTLGSDILMHAYQNFTQSSPLPLLSVSGQNGFHEGVLSFNITNSTRIKGGTFHLEIPVWLWYSSLANKEYQALGDCSTHPCFEYKFLENATATGIKSGETKGVSIGKDYNSTYQKSGVKTFR